MKTPHVYLIIAAIAATLSNAATGYGQASFDEKKKESVPANITSLQPIRINGSQSKNATARASLSLHTQLAPLSKPALQSGKPKVFYSPETGLPSFVTTQRSGNTFPAISTDPAAASANYIDELKPVLAIKSSHVGFIVSKVATSRDNKTRVRLTQHYKGIPIYGAEVVVHLNSRGEGESFNGAYYDIQQDISTTPGISMSSALQIVREKLSVNSAPRSLTDMERKLVQYGQPLATLCVFQDKSLVKKFVLAYHIVTTPSIHQRWEYFLDAQTGKVLDKFSSVCFLDGPKTATAADLNGVARTINTYLKGSSYYLIDASRPMFNGATSVMPDEPVGGIITIDMNNTFGDNTAIRHLTSLDNVWNSDNFRRAVSAHYNAGVAYDYFESKHIRTSIDGAGGTMISVINVADEKGAGLDNAFWNGKAMFYGNGKTGFKSLAGSLDVAGHEMTHGVVENTANLEYQGESGAINESMADIFGAMLDPADWLIGEDVVKMSAYPSGALRSLQDPHNGGARLGDPGYQPRHMSEKYTGAEDNEGVHVNSGIPNHAFFRYAEAITREKAAAVFYKALGDYLTKSSKFVDLRLAVIKAAGDLFGTGSNEASQAGMAFDAVGIGSGQGGDYTESLPDNPGTEFFLIYNTDPADPNTLYRATLNGSSANALSQTDFLSRPSVTDDGTVAVFVGSDHKIHALNTAPGTEPEEFILQDEAIWSNVVISKGGTKLAAVTNAQDAAIYVYDFQSESWAEFALYNPTYTEGVNSGGPVYADALEWDYNGEILVYDCFNRIENDDGADIEYWDVNFIQVWDNEANDFSDGTIAKLFPSLPPDVSIGNPSFSKVSPYIIAFDYFDVSTDEYAVLGCNIETNEVNAVALNTSLGWPSYNKTDTRIAFTSMEGETYITNYVVVNSDKISSSADPVGLFTEAKWPVYFSTGERVIGDQLVTAINEPTKENIFMTCYPNPVVSELSVLLSEPSLPDTRVQLMNAIGQDIFDNDHSASAAGGYLALDLSKIESGYYVLRLSNGRKTGSCRVVKR